MKYSEENNSELMFIIRIHGKDQVYEKEFFIEYEDFEQLFTAVTQIVDWELVDIPGAPFDWDIDTRASFVAQFLTENKHLFLDDDLVDNSAEDDTYCYEDALNDMWVGIDDLDDPDTLPRFVIKAVNRNVLYSEGFVNFVTAESMLYALADEYEDEEFRIIDTFKNTEHVFRDDDDNDDDSCLYDEYIYN